MKLCLIICQKTCAVICVPYFYVYPEHNFYFCTVNFQVLHRCFNPGDLFIKSLHGASSDMVQQSLWIIIYSPYKSVRAIGSALESRAALSSLCSAPDQRSPLGSQTSIPPDTSFRTRCTAAGPHLQLGYRRLRQEAAGKSQIFPPKNNIYMPPEDLPRMWFPCGLGFSAFQTCSECRLSR